MQYFALLISKEQDRTPEEWAAGMAEWERFHAKAGAAIKAGDALAPVALTWGVIAIAMALAAYGARI